MAIYKIFPEQSATLYSYYPTLNTGLDEILELSTFESYEVSNEVSRVLVQFPIDEINNIINSKIGTASFDAYVKLYLANASELPLNYSIYCHPIATRWDAGIGRLANSPITTDGVSWGYVNQESGSAWFIAGTFPNGTTGSYQAGSNLGGGLWWTGSQYVASQSFTQKTDKDIELKVTNTVLAWNSGSIGNYGIILKHSGSLEFTSASKFETKYFSNNTHTIYPPCLELRWNDFYYTSSLTQASSQDVVVTLANNVNEYQQDAVQRFRINVRDKYPARAFTTSSVYLNNKILPTSSYWSIKDLDTEEIVVDYDSTYTKISADNTGNYFDVYMNGLEPERYYQIIIKTIINGSTLVLDDKYYFKVVR